MTRTLTWNFLPEKLANIFLNRQTYKNILYLLLSFPLGLFYFVVLSICLSAGVVLSPLIIGIYIIALTLAASVYLIKIEIVLTNKLLQKNIKTTLFSQPLFCKTNFHAYSKKLALNVSTWKGIVYLFLKLLMGTLSFFLLVLTLTISLSFLTAPIIIYLIDPLHLGTWKIDTFQEAILLVPFGFVFLAISFTILNSLSELHFIIAHSLLGASSTGSEETGQV